MFGRPPCLIGTNAALSISGAGLAGSLAVAEAEKTCKRCQGDQAATRAGVGPAFYGAQITSRFCGVLRDTSHEPARITLTSYCPVMLIGQKRDSGGEMLRIIIREENNAAACYVPGAVAEHSWKTFDVELPEVESYLREYENKPNAYTSRIVVGIEKK